MTSDAERWQRISELFHEALQHPAEHRAAFLRSCVGSDEALVSDVLALVDASARTQSVLDAPAVQSLPEGMRLGP